MNQEELRKGLDYKMRRIVEESGVEVDPDDVAVLVTDEDSVNGSCSRVDGEYQIRIPIRVFDERGWGGMCNQLRQGIALYQ